jgi:FKBP-type peptidyl-prolyl cis-trans isomerase
MRKTAYLLLFIIPFFMGCEKSHAVLDNEAIQAYVSAHNLNATVEANGLYFVPVSGGAGVYATSATTATVSFKGTLTNGGVFDQSSSFSFSLADPTLIPAWSEGIPLMQKGQTAMLLVPSALAYGSTAQPSAGGSYVAIPANSVLIFTITLISFQQ